MDLQLEALSKYIVTTPSWAKSLLMIILLGLSVEILAILGHRGPQGQISLFAIFAYMLPALAALFLTPRLIHVFGGKLTYEWSGLISVIGLVISLFISLSPVLFFTSSFSLFFAVSLAFVFAVRMLLLAVVVDFHISRVVVPALIQSGIALAFVTAYLGTQFLLLSVLLHGSFAIGVVVFILVIERPMKANFKIGPLELANAFLAHLLEGSKKLDDYFRSIGEKVIVPQVSLVFSREQKPDVTVTIPNVHPGPLGEIGGSNLPKILHSMLGEGSMVLHGSATHDFNPVDETEVRKVGDAVLRSLPSSHPHQTCSVSRRYRTGSVDVLAQVFGDCVILVATRSPEVTEDLDFSIGFAIMKSGERYFSHVGFVDAHNSMSTLEPGVSPASALAMEYIEASEMALKDASRLDRYNFSIGYAARALPFTREQGFGDLGVQVMVVIAGGQKTAYVLFDGNNMETGVREEIRRRLRAHVDECEVMTTDTHVVNTVSGKNQVGLRVLVDEFYPLVEKAVTDALHDAAPASMGSSTAWCRDIVIFGSQRISQIASTVNGMMGFMLPVAIVILICAFLTTAMAYLVLTY
jgi:putative membrane protein